MKEIKLCTNVEPAFCKYNMFFLFRTEFNLSDFLNLNALQFDDLYYIKYRRM